MSDVAKKQPSSAKVRKRVVAPSIDRDKLRTAVRRLGDEYVFYMLDEAIDLLPPAKLVKLVGRYLDVQQLRPDADAVEKTLLAEVRAFDAASRAGNYYESFNVNSKNCTDTSAGTRAFIADCNRLLDRCVARASKDSAVEIREAIEIVLGLLRYIDECHDDVIFFADEGGAWQVGVDWARVLPALFLSFSRTMTPAEYDSRVVEILDEFDKHNREEHLAAAHRIGETAARTNGLAAARSAGELD